MTPCDPLRTSLKTAQLARRPSGDMLDLNCGIRMVADVASCVSPHVAPGAGTRTTL
jgi:hypothetical protein